MEVADTIVPITMDGKVDEESENSALNPLYPSVEPGTVKQTVTRSSVSKVVIAGGASLPENLDFPFIEGLILIQFALESFES